MENLSHQEITALLALYKIEKGTIKQILGSLEENIPYTTFASTIKNLEKKDLVKSELIGNTYLFTPVLEEDVFKKTYLSNVVEGFFSNSYKALVNFFIQQKTISTDELKDIINTIEGSKKS